MRIAYMSDLHIEFETARTGLAGWQALDAARRSLPGHPDRGPLLDAINEVDLVVLAGDIDVGTRGIAYADAVAQYMETPVVYVAGNHESYQGDLPRLRQELEASAWATDGRVFYLEQGMAALWIGDERLYVLGCTLWTDYRLEGDAPEAMQRARARVSDFQQIMWHGAAFRPEDAEAIHRRSRGWIGDQIDQIRHRESDARIVVVSHHAPIPIALEPWVADVAPCYASDLSAAIAKWRPDVWFHGHSHLRHRTRCHETWVVSAPLGYPSQGRGSYAYAPGVIEL